MSKRESRPSARRTARRAASPSSEEPPTSDASQRAEEASASAGPNRAGKKRAKPAKKKAAPRAAKQKRPVARRSSAPSATEAKEKKSKKAKAKKKKKKKTASAKKPKKAVAKKKAVPKKESGKKASPKKRKVSARARASRTVEPSERTEEATRKKTPRKGASAKAGRKKQAAVSLAESVDEVPEDADIEDEEIEAVVETNPYLDAEEKVDRLLGEADSIAGDPKARRRAAEALAELAARLGGYEEEIPPPVDDDVFSRDYYLRRWGRLAMRHRSEEVDAFGLDAKYEARLQPVFETAYRNWFQVQTEGVHNVPSEGRALIIANHGGALPWDGLMMRTALRLEHPAGRTARWLAEDFSYHMPFLGAFLTRVGAVRACPENAERLLDDGELLTVFPEGIKGVGKLYRQRYRLQRFGRGGYVKVALRTQTPIIPAGIVGAEEAYPLLFKSDRLAKVLGLPFLPITPLFPLLGPIGLLPLPSRWAVVFGEPIDLSEHPPEAENDTLLVNQINERVRSEVESLVARALISRPSAWTRPV